jgi:hypothetical protein
MALAPSPALAEKGFEQASSETPAGTTTFSVPSVPGAVGQEGIVNGMLGEAVMARVGPLIITASVFGHLPAADERSEATTQLLAQMAAVPPSIKSLDKTHLDYVHRQNLLHAALKDMVIADGVIVLAMLAVFVLSAVMGTGRMVNGWRLRRGSGV